MVGQQVLVLFIGVRISTSEQNNEKKSSRKRNNLSDSD